MTLLGRYLLAVSFGLALGVGLTVGAGLLLGVRPAALQQTAGTPTPAAPGAPTATAPTPRASAQVAPPVSTNRTLGPLGLDEDAVADLFERVAPSVVNVSVQVPRASASAQNTGARQGSGSGFLVDAQGHILTNEHVIRDASRIEVTLADGLKMPAEVRGRDTLNDIALLKIEAPSERLRPVMLGDSTAVRVGQLAVVIGNPYGFARTLTVGVVSGVGRPIEDAGRRPLLDMIQTDAAINPGNSGGPLLNSRGEVVGITTLVDRSQLSVGFAVPINTALQIMPNLISGQKVARPWLGIAGVALTPVLAEQLAVKIDQGILVREATPGGPAERAGIRGGTNENPASGDVILEIERRAVTRVADLVASIDSLNVGDTVSVTLVRDGSQQTVQVTLGEYPAESR
ncbi:MAG: trypsin-like peptidase domain-containing protein [Chloroflexi bacterium]|nr:trypsin-like peptidase domain-containing protein [Chloroflexota bacterium]